MEKINFNYKSNPIFGKGQQRKRRFFTYFYALAILAMLITPTIIVLLPKETERGNNDHDAKLIEQKIYNVNQQAIEIEVLRTKTNEVEKVPLEMYVKSVVAAEMPVNFELEALKAQAVAARTYIINHLLHKIDDDKIITDTTDHQVYRNKEELAAQWGADFEQKWDKINQAVNLTEGLVITFDEQPITPTFFSMSNGYTEDAKNYWGNELPYLKSVESKWEEHLPNFIDQKVMTKQEINSLLQIELAQKVAVEVKRTPSNRVKEINIDGKLFSGREIREKLNLRSSDFTISQKDNYLIFTTKGYGHGVGMSQYGANEMAKIGKTYKEILSYYYQGVDLMPLASFETVLASK